MKMLRGTQKYQTGTGHWDIDTSAKINASHTLILVQMAAGLSAYDRSITTSKFVSA